MRHQFLIKAVNQILLTSSQSVVGHSSHICFVSYETCCFQHEPPDINYEKLKQPFKRKYLQQLIISLFNGSERRIQNVHVR